jgi:hypothetical protein
VIKMRIFDVIYDIIQEKGEFCLRKSRNRQDMIDKKGTITTWVINDLICCNFNIYVIYMPTLGPHFIY